MSALPPKAVFDATEKMFTSSQLALICGPAEYSAQQIREELRKRRKIVDCFWTPEPGDVEKITGVPDPQRIDDSNVALPLDDRKYATITAVWDPEGLESE